MNLWISLDKDFEEFFLGLEKTHKEYLKIEGLSNDKLDPTRFFKGFIKSGNVADASIDPNSNVNSQNMTTLLHEMSKPFQKLVSFNKLFIELKEEYGKEFACKAMLAHIEGDIFIHDAAGFSYFPYCYAYTLKDVVEKGLFFINEMKAEPPKHLNTFNSHTMETIAFLTNLQSGAVGLPDYLLYSFFFWNKDVKEGYIQKEDSEKVKYQQFQKMIFELNQPYLKINQSAYTNFTILDRDYFYGLFGSLVFPDGTLAVDIVEEFMQYQKDFLNYEKEIRKTKSFTFPVLTFSGIFKDGNWKDEDMAKFVVRHNMEWADVNMYQSGNPEALSSCCFDGKQKVLAKGRNVLYDTFENIYNLPYNEYKKNFRIFHNGNWVYGKIKKIEKKEKQMYKVTTVNNKELLMTEDHISVTSRGEVETKFLNNEDYIAFSNKELGLIPERNMNLTYEQGVLIGAYLGDGSKASDERSVILFLNPEKVKLLIEPIKKALLDWNLDCKISITERDNNNMSVRLGVGSLEIIEEWVYGNYCYEKDLNLDCLLQSPEFRKGIIEGLYITDGGNSNRIYSTSKKQTESIEVVLTSLGIQSVIDVSDRTDETVIIRGEEFKRNYPLYCIRYYKQEKNIRNIKNIYKTINNTTYFKIKSIEKYNAQDEYVYCFEMENQEEPYFTLPNGVITHNCRAEFNLEDIKGNKKLEGNFNSIGSADLSIGSTKVIDINLARVGYKSKGNLEKAKEIVKELTDMIQKIHYIHREKILKKNIERGLLPNYTHGLMKLERQYATVGIAAMMEFAEFMGGIDRNEIGELTYNDKGVECLGQITEYINKLGENTIEKYNYTQSQETSPNESGASLLYKKDLMYFPEYPIKTILYSNQWCSLSENFDLFERIRVDGLLANRMKGGNILHLNINEKWASFEDAWNFNLAVARAGCKYWSEIRKFQYCKNDHNFYGSVCPICNEKAEGDILKVVGYLVKNEYYQKERREEMDNRFFYSL